MDKGQGDGFCNSLNISGNDGSAYRECLLRRFNGELKNTVLPVTVFIGIETFVAFFGNILVLYVFLLHYKSCNFRYFVLCLAFVDITSSLTTMPGEVLTQSHWFIYPSEAICKVKSFFNVWTVTVEATCLLTIAVDRYLKVCRPFGFQIKPRLAICLCLVAFIIGFALAMPAVFLWGLQYNVENYHGTNITTVVCERAEMYKDTQEPLKYSISLQTSISFTLLVMVVLYVFIIRRLLKDRSKLKASLKSSSHRTNHKHTPTSPLASNEMQLSSTTESNENQIIQPEKTEKLADNSYLKNQEITENKRGRQSDSDIENASSMTGVSESEVDMTASDKKPAKRKQSERKVSRPRVRRKTLIMFILTAVFVLTTVMYFTCVIFITKNALRYMDDALKVIFFFFFRLYFINHAINPIVYGMLDPTFRSAMSHVKEMIIKKCSRKEN